MGYPTTKDDTYDVLPVSHIAMSLLLTALLHRKPRLVNMFTILDMG
jgi:hypothetical protein